MHKSMSSLLINADNSNQLINCTSTLNQSENSTPL